MSSRTAWNDYAAERAEARREAEHTYDERQMRYGENVPPTHELDGEARQS